MTNRLLLLVFIFAATFANRGQAQERYKFGINGLQCGMSYQIVEKKLLAYAEPKDVVKSELVSPYFPHLTFSRYALEIDRAIAPPLVIQVRFMKDKTAGMIFCRHSPMATIELNGKIVLRTGDSKAKVRTVLAPFISKEDGNYIHCFDTEGQELILNFLKEDIILFTLGRVDE